MDSVMNNLNGLLVRDVRWKVRTAGPSPFNNERTEIFLLGCKKAMMGNPCKGCFNSSTWDTTRAEFSHDPVLMAKHISQFAPNKYVTIGGGEPTDQIDNLITLCRELKGHGFHVMIYTWRNLNKILHSPYISFDKIDEISRDPAAIYVLERTIFPTKMRELLKYVDIVVDGEYDEKERLWCGDKGDGLISSVGSGNQIIWDIKNKFGFAMRDIEKLELDHSNSLTYKTNDQSKKIELKGWELSENDIC